MAHRPLTARGRRDHPLGWGLGYLFGSVFAHRLERSDDIQDSLVFLVNDGQSGILLEIEKIGGELVDHLSIGEVLSDVILDLFELDLPSCRTFSDLQDVEGTRSRNDIADRVDGKREYRAFNLWEAIDFRDGELPATFGCFRLLGVFLDQELEVLAGART